MKLLIVDDEKLIRDVITEYANHEKFETVQASDGEEALNIIAKENIDLVVLDIMMHKMDGLTFLKEMKKVKNIPIIGLSAKVSTEDKVNCLLNGANDYLTKPFEKSELLAESV